MTQRLKSRLGIALGAGLLVAGLTGTLVSPAAADSRSDRLEKQVRIFERAVDQMLVDSPNFLVHSSEATQGMILEGRGVVFGFKTSLNTFPWRTDGHGWHWFRHDDDRVIIIDDDGAVVRNAKDWRRDQLPEQERLYRDGKKEIVDTILDFGEVLSTLDDDDTLEIRARLQGADYFHENDLKKLTVKVKMRDLRDYLDGRIDRDQARSRIQMEES